MGMTNAKAVSEFGWLVERIARGFVRPGIEFDDLSQEGFLGLFEAVRTWVDGAGSSFKAWANIHIKKKVEEAAGVGITKASRQTRFLMEASSLEDAALPDGKERLSMHETVGTQPIQDTVVMLAEREAAIERLPASDRELLQVWRDLEPEAPTSTPPTSQIAKRMGLSQQRVSERCQDALGRLERLIKHRVAMRRSAPMIATAA
jgi:RNA polymerase sigma factor (sigma-70 family)